MDINNIHKSLFNGIISVGVNSHNLEIREEGLKIIFYNLEGLKSNFEYLKNIGNNQLDSDSSIIYKSYNLGGLKINYQLVSDSSKVFFLNYRTTRREFLPKIPSISWLDSINNRMGIRLNTYLFENYGLLNNRFSTINVLTLIEVRRNGR